MDFLMNILESNLNYGSIISIFLLYIFLIWLMLCVWVFIDAKKRYGKLWVAIGLFFLVLILNLPALVFYLIIRPDNEEDNVLYLHSEDGASNSGGVNVPIVNFTGQDGFVISLQLKVANTNAQADLSGNNMNINVEFNSQNESMKVVQTPKAVEVTTNQDSIKQTIVLPRVKAHGIRLANRFKVASSKLVGSVQSYAKNIDAEEVKPEESKPTKPEQNKNTKKSSHSKKQKRKK